MTLQNLLQLNVITSYMCCIVVNDKGMVEDMAPYWRVQNKLKFKEIYVLDIDYVSNTIIAHVR